LPIFCKANSLAVERAKLIIELLFSQEFLFDCLLSCLLSFALYYVEKLRDCRYAVVVKRCFDSE